MPTFSSTCIAPSCMAATPSSLSGSVGLSVLTGMDQGGCVIAVVELRRVLPARPPPRRDRDRLVAKVSPPIDECRLHVIPKLVTTGEPPTTHSVRQPTSGVEPVFTAKDVCNSYGVAREIPVCVRRDALIEHKNAGRIAAIGALRANGGIVRGVD